MGESSFVCCVSMCKKCPEKSGGFVLWGKWLRTVCDLWLSVPPATSRQVSSAPSQQVSTAAASSAEPRPGVSGGTWQAMNGYDWPKTDVRQVCVAVHRDRFFCLSVNQMECRGFLLLRVLTFCHSVSGKSAWLSIWVITVINEYRHNEYWQWFQPPLGKKRRVLHSVLFRDQDWWHTGVSRLKLLAVNFRQ